MALRKPRITLTAVAVSALGLAACESKSSHLPDDAGKLAKDESSAVKANADLLGTWTLESVDVEKDGAEPSRYEVTGIAAWTFRKNGTYFFDSQVFSLKGESKSYESCTSYGSGTFVVVDGQATLSDRVLVPVGGDCQQGFALKLDDQVGEVKRAGDKLTLTLSIEPKGKAPRKHHFHMKKTTEEGWTGQGLDPRLRGKWKLAKVTTSSYCTDEKAGFWDQTLTGTYTVAVRDKDFDEAFDGFDYYNDPPQPCQAAVKGATLVTNLNIELRRDSVSNECAKTAFVVGETVNYVRDLVTAKGEWIHVVDWQTADDTCAAEYGKQFYMTDMFVFTRLE